MYTEVTGEKVSRRNFLSSLGEELIRTGNSSSHGEDSSDDREEQWQLASGQSRFQVKMSTKETWLQSPVTDAVNLFSENVKGKNIGK